MRILVIGGVAAGTKAAAKLKREDRSAQVKVLNKGEDISYAGCGLPYYVGGSIGTREELIVNTPQKYAGLTGAEVVTGCEVTHVDPAAKTVSGLLHGESFTESYDELIIATGAAPFVPDMPGKALPGVFPMRTPDDAVGLRDYVSANGCRKAVVAGAGFIGLEIAENLLGQGLDVTVVDFADQIMPNAFDPEMADFARRKLKEAGVRVLTGQRIQSVTGTDKATGIVTDGGSIAADVVVLAIGVRPATDFLADTGIELFKGTVVVDELMRTNLPHIYAAGDCAMVRSAITGKGQWSAMGSTANLTARALAYVLPPPTAAAWVPAWPSCSPSSTWAAPASPRPRPRLRALIPQPWCASPTTRPTTIPVPPSSSPSWWPIKTPASCWASRSSAPGPWTRW